MGLGETEEVTLEIFNRMENTMNNLEQMSFDSINITDRLVTLLSEARDCVAIMKDPDAEEREEAIARLEKNLMLLLETAFTVNNVAHELEKETVYQRDTLESIRQIMEFLYTMMDDVEL